MVRVSRNLLPSLTGLQPVVSIVAILFQGVWSVPGALAYCAYVTNQHSADVSVIDTATATVADVVAVDRYPGGVASTPDGRFVYVICNHGDPDAIPVWKIDTSSNYPKPTAITLADLGGGPPWFVAIDARRPVCLRNRFRIQSSSRD